MAKRMGVGSKFVLMFSAVGAVAYLGNYAVKKYDPIVEETKSLPILNIPKGILTKAIQEETPQMNTYSSPFINDGPMKYRWDTIPWNAMSGAMYSVYGGENSLMTGYGINMTIRLNDSYPQMQNNLIAFVEEYYKGNTHTTAGSHFVTIMGNGAPAFLAELNTKLRAKFGSEYIAQIIAVVGYSRGEDKCMATPEAFANYLRGSLLLAVKADGDEDICFAWMAANEVLNNPDPNTWDATKANWVHTETYVDADNKWISGYCEDRKVIVDGVKTGETINVCADGLGTWSPGDDIVVREKGGLVTVASTKDDYMWLMPASVITIKKFAQDNREDVKKILSAVLEGGTRVNASYDNLLLSGEMSSNIYGVETPEYWAKLYNGYVLNGIDIGGSYSNNLGDAISAFGLREGEYDIMTSVLNNRGKAAQSQYPKMIRILPNAKEVIDKSYIRELMNQIDTSKVVIKPFTPTFSSTSAKTITVGRKSWDLRFKTGSSSFSKESLNVLKEIADEESLSGLSIEIHGYTDNTGSVKGNKYLSGKRGNSVKGWLVGNYPKTFPSERIKVIANGQDDPIATNDTPEGRAKNRRVEIWLVK